MNKLSTFYRISIIALWIVLGNSITAFGYGSGITGQTQSGCTCHGGSNTATSLSIQGVTGTSITMTPGENRSFTVIVAHSTQPKAGVDISIKNSGGSNVGTLSAGSGLQLTGGELTHSTKKDITSGQSTFTFNWTAPSSTGDYLFRAAGNAVNNNGNVNGDEWNFLSTVTITVATPSIVVTTPNGGETVCRNSQTNITWTPTLINGNVKIEYTTDGTNFTQIATVPATPANYIWSIPAGQTIASTYKIKVSDATNASIFDISDANFTISSAPVITTQPKPDTLCPGSPTTFSVVTDNPTGYTYQWRKGGNNIAGATATSYTIPSVQVSDGASYDVVVTGCSVLTSSSVTLIINSPPAITSQPNDTNVCPGTLAKLSATATGTNLTYQWKLNNTNIVGATNPTLTISSVTPADTGSYVVVVTGKCNPPQSTSAIKLRFTPAPTITKQPRDTTVCLGETVQFSVDGVGAGLTFQWQKDGKNIDGAQGSNLVIPGVTNLNIGSYTAIVKNSCNLTTTSTAAILKAREPVTISNQPKDTSVQTNLTAKFSVTATGTDVKYQWMKNGINRIGDTLSTLTISNVTLSDSGNYKCTVKNLCGNVESTMAKLTVTAPPAGAALALSVSTVDFGCSKVKSNKDTVLSNVIFNGGGLPLNVTAVEVKGVDAADFTIVNGGGSFTLAPTEKRTITIRFSASTKATKNASIEFTSNSSTAAPNLTLTGKGCGGTIASVTASSGSTNIGTTKDTSFQICNSGDFDLIVTQISFANSNMTEFKFGDIPTLPLILKPGDCATIHIKFSPEEEGVRSTHLVVTTDEGNFSIDISGTGTPSTGVDESVLSASGISVYPNPTSGNIKFTGEVLSAMPVNIKIFDALGNYIYQSLMDIPAAGNFNFTWDGTSQGKYVSAGYYTAVLSFGTQTVRIPFVIIR